MFKRKNKDNMTMTALVDTVISALIMNEEEYKVTNTDEDTTIEWKNHKVVIKGEYIWFDKKAQYSVYNVINCIKARN